MGLSSQWDVPTDRSPAGPFHPRRGHRHSTGRISSDEETRPVCSHFAEAANPFVDRAVSARSLPRRGGTSVHLPHSPGGPASSSPEKTRTTKMMPSPIANQGERMHHEVSFSNQVCGVRPLRPRPQSPSREPVFSTDRSNGIVA